MADPLRIAMVTTFYPPLNFGGDGRYIRRMVHALARRGCEVEVIHDADAWRVLAGKDAPMAPIEPEPPGVTVRRLESRWPVGSALLTQQLGTPVVHGGELHRLLDGRFDVIHYHNVSLVGGAGVLKIGDGLKLYTAHEHWLVCPMHVLWRHNRELCTGRQCFRCALEHHRPPQFWRLTGALERACKDVDVFIAMSRSTADNHRAFGFPFEMTLMPSFLSEDEVGGAPEVEAVPPPERPFFLFVGRLEIIKGLQDVIPLFDQDMPADLLIAGEGNYGEELRRLAEGRPNVKFLGQLGPQELTRLYRQTLALIAASSCYEVFPMVMLEAFREGTPVIARELGPYPEIVEQSGAGLTFRTAEELRAALMRFVAEPDLRDRLGASGRKALAERWSEPVVIDAYLDLIQTVAAAKGREDTAIRAAATPRARKANARRSRPANVPAKSA
jgi:glycosyltransferase involved in cell wall biosynthesis